LTRIASAEKQFLTAALEEYIHARENTLILNFHEDFQSGTITVPVYFSSSVVEGIVFTLRRLADSVI